MKNFSLPLAAILTATALTSASAEVMIYTQSHTCSDLKSIVAQTANVLLTSDKYAYEMVHRDSGACEQDESSAPAYEPSSDVPACFVGWRCKQRNSDNGVG